MEPPLFPGLPKNITSCSAKSPYKLKEDEDSVTEIAVIAAAVSCLVLLGAAAAFLAVRRRKKQQARQQMDNKGIPAVRQPHIMPASWY